MKRIKSAIGTAIGVIMVIFYVGVISYVVLEMAIEKDPSLEERRQQVLCIIGLPSADSDCINDQLAELREEQRAVIAERDQLARVTADYETRQRELEARNATVENYTQFQSQIFSFGSVSMGITFASVLEPEVWSKAYCYLAVGGQGASRIHVDLAAQEQDESIKWERISTSDLMDIGLTENQFTQAKTACHFPEVT